jgi:hypothetical protein
MEISPISGIRAIPVAKVPPSESDLSRVFDIENSSKPGDDTYSGSGKKAAGGEDDEPEDNVEPEESADDEPAVPSAGNGDSTQINFFA